MLLKLLKLLGLLLLLVAMAAGVGALYIARSPLPSYPTRPPEVKVESTPARVERGRALVELLCANCHLDPATGVMSGTRMHDAPPAFGEIHARNITADRHSGIGAWSDGEIIFLLRTGITPGGTYLPPYMVKLPTMADEDLHSIVAFLRSTDPLVAPTAKPNVPSRPSFLVKFLTRVAWKPYPFPDRPIAPPPASDKVAQGRYLVHQLGCFACHSADFKKLDELQPERSLGYLGGGNRLLDMSGNSIYAGNITFDAETGIGKWTEAQFIRALREGFRPDSTPLRYPMVKAPRLSVDEASAMYAYLKTVPVISHPRPADPVKPELAALSEGERLYLRYQCHSCHGLTGVGLADLRLADKKYPKDEGLKAWIRQPSRIKPNTRMPDWEGVIAEAEYPPLMAFVRKLGQKGGAGAAAPP